MGQITGTARDNAGNVSSNAKIYVYLTGTTTLVSLFEERALSTPLDNPLPVDSVGSFTAFFDDAVVDIHVTRSGETTQIIRGYAAVDPDNYPRLAGRAGGQIQYGGTASGNGYTLRSSSHATKGPLTFEQASGFVFNEDGRDADFRVEGDTEVNLFFTDASTERVGIGTAGPTHRLDVRGSVAATSLVRLQNTNATGFSGINYYDEAGTDALFFGLDLGSNVTILSAHSSYHFNLWTGGVNRFTISGAGVGVWNEPGNDCDFRFEGDNVPDLLFIDASTDRIGIHTNSPQGDVHLNRTVDSNVVFYAQNPSTGTSARAEFRINADVANTLLTSHSSNRVNTRYGVTMGGWSELTLFAGNGLAIGTSGVASPLVFGTNNIELMRLDTAAATANQTNLLVMEGNPRTQRRVQWKLQSALVAGDRVMVLV